MMSGSGLSCRRQNIVHDLRQRGVALKATEQPIDTSTPAGKSEPIAR